MTREARAFDANAAPGHAKGGIDAINASSRIAKKTTSV